MGQWNYASGPNDRGEYPTKVNLTENDDTGALSGTVLFREVTFNVTGQWAAAGSDPERNFSVFWFGGGNSDVSIFLSAVGNIEYAASPPHMDVTITTASAANGQDYGYNDRLFGTDAAPASDPDEE